MPRWLAAGMKGGVLSRVELGVVETVEKKAHTAAVRKHVGAVGYLTEVGLKSTHEAVDSTRGTPVKEAVSLDK